MRKVALLAAVALALVGVAAATALPSAKTLPGIAAVDVYGNLKKQGMKCSGPKVTSGRSSWTCRGTTGFVELYAYTAGTGATRISIVQASVAGTLAKPTQGTPRDYLAFVATLPYDGSKPAGARSWVARNFTKAHAVTRIGPAVFELWGKAKSVLLEIRPA